LHAVNEVEVIQTVHTNSSWRTKWAIKK